MHLNWVLWYGAVLDITLVLLQYALPGLATIIFQQDNARPHVARIVQRFFVNHQIELLPWPARSPDLSLIESMWSMVAQRLTQITPPVATPDQLWQRVGAAWSAVPHEHIQSLFELMPRCYDRYFKLQQGRIDYLILVSAILLGLSLGESVIDSGPDIDKLLFQNFDPLGCPDLASYYLHTCSIEGRSDEFTTAAKVQRHGSHMMPGIILLENAPEGHVMKAKNFQPSAICPALNTKSKELSLLGTANQALCGELKQRNLPSFTQNSVQRLHAPKPRDYLFSVHPDRRSITFSLKNSNQPIGSRWRQVLQEHTANGSCSIQDDDNNFDK
ncbi:transposable element Tcb1 transposase [Trichonephila clavipes]|nr:transposable element Tcb1 transposase [Trichonephila clavipes]